MLTVHHLENSRSQRVVWLLEELGVDYEIRHYARDPASSRAPAELRRLHPFGKLPLLQDGEAVLAESGAILDHLAQRYGDGRLVPEPGSRERLRYAYWLHAAEGSLMPLLVTKLMFTRVHARAPRVVRPLVRAISSQVHAAWLGPDLDAMLAFMDAELTRSEWFAGDTFTAADVQMGYPIEAAEVRGSLDERHPRLRDFLSRARARPAYRRAIERGGAFAPAAA